MAKIKTSLKPINTPVFGYWAALYLSFYSKRLYIDVGKRWPGFGIKYLLLVMVLWAIPFSIKMAADFNEIFNQQLIQPLSIIPTIFIQNGEASFDKPMPYLVKNDKNQVVLIVDTTGTVNDFSNKYPQLTILINKKQVAFKMPKPQLPGSDVGASISEPLVQTFGPGENLVFDGKKIVEQNAISQWKHVAQLTIYPIVLVVFFSMFLTMFLILGFLGQLFTRIFFSFQITLKQSSRLLMVAATPMMLLLLVILSLNLTFPGFGMLILPVLILYFCYAVYCFRTESRQVVSL